MGKIYYNGVDYSAPVVSGVSGIKGNAETTYRTGNVNLTPANIGLGNVNNTADSAKSVKYAATAGSATPVAHASTATTYGKSTGSNYGHTKLSDTYTSSVGDASSGVAASQKALFDAYSTLNSNLTNISNKVNTKDLEALTIEISNKTRLKISFATEHGFCLIFGEANHTAFGYIVTYTDCIELKGGYKTERFGNTWMVTLGNWATATIIRGSISGIVVAVD